MVPGISKERSDGPNGQEIASPKISRARLFPYRPHKTPLQTIYLEFAQSTISRFPEIDFPIQLQTSLVDVYPLGELLSSTVRKKEPIQLAVSNSYLRADY